jgi:hypothetical protein
MGEERTTYRVLFGKYERRKIHVVFITRIKRN